MSIVLFRRRFYKETLKQRVHRHLLQFLLYHVPDCVVTLTEKDLAFYKDASVRSERIYNALDDKLWQRRQYIIRRLRSC